LPEIVDAAVANGYGAIELRGLGAHIDVPDAPEFAPDLRPAVRDMLRSRGVTISCVSSSANLTSPSPDHLVAHCILAHDLGAPFVRVFGGSAQPGEAWPATLSRASKTLRHYGDLAAEHGVAVVVETHDSFSLGEKVAEVLEHAHHANTFALWDLHHPFRNGESPEKTAQLLAPWVRYVHVKDGIPEHNTLLGEGDVPIHEMLKLLVSGGYTGVFSVEWEKRWQPQIEAPDIALPQYAHKLREYLSDC
jgi:sugar phosphate isomerase/epimerase